MAPIERSSDDRSERPAIGWTVRASDGLPSFGWDNAEVKCPECDGWKGTVCPHGCGVHLVSTQREDDQRTMERLRANAAERKARQAARKAERNG